MAKREHMTDDELRAVVRSQITSSLGFVEGQLAEDRRKAMDYYYGEKFGNEVDGRSAVVSTDVQDVVEGMMPDMMEMFAGGSNVVEYAPKGPEDEQAAKQATDFGNHVWWADNDGYRVTHDWIKDALLQKNGTVKIWWDDTPIKTRVSKCNVNSLELAELMADETVEIIEQEEKEPSQEELMFAPDGVLYDLTILKTDDSGRIRVENVPPEEFLIARQSKDVDSSPFTGHRTLKTVSELIEMGFDPEELEDIPTSDTINEEHVNRYEDEEDLGEDSSLDESMRRIEIIEAYIRVDYDGDGVAEMRQVTCAGNGYKILRNEECEDNPFASMTPIRVPHKWAGRSLADLVMDIQFIKSTVERQLLDNMYQVNNSRAAISERVNLEDYLNNRVGAPVRISGQGGVGDAIMPLPTIPLGQQAFPLLEYFDTSREERTGITRLDQGMDPNSLNKTAFGINQMLGRTQQRKLMMARTIAEMGFKPAFKKILKLLVNYQQKPRVVRLRNTFVQIDPRSWNAEMDVDVKVGLGHGTREGEMMMGRTVMEMMEKVIQYQGGLNGPLVGLPQIHRAFADVLTTLGKKNTDQYLIDIEKQPPQPQQPKPDPKMEEAQANIQIRQAEMQATDARERQKIALQHEREMKKIELEHQASMARNQAEAGRTSANLQRRAGEAIGGLEIKQAQADADYALKASKAQADTAIKAATTGAELNRKENEAMGNLAIKDRMAQNKETDI
jgi:hypothetical protein